MDHFIYKNKELYAENVAIKKIAEEVGTPFYCYSTATLLRHYTVFTDSFKNVKATICFAVKANSNLAVLKTISGAGAGGDCVSEGEIRRCLKAGIPADKIVFSGVGKTKDEMAYALESGIKQFNIESEAELYALNEVAGEIGKKAPVAFRVNPDVDAKTHDKISTGRKTDKFGVEYDIARELYKKASKLENIEVQGIATHIGSQLTSLDPLQQAFVRIADMVELLRKDGHNIKVLDLGGGLGIPYDRENPPLPSEYAKMVLDTVGHLGCELVFEPGRLIAGNAGILVTKVIYLKSTSERDFVVVDAAMNDLVRPAMYDSHHEIIPVDECDAEGELVDVVGPICETTDIFAKQRLIGQLSDDDLVVLRSCGAYGAVMSSNYNSRLLIPEVLVHEDQFALIRKRQTYDEMLSLDQIPEWL